MTEPVNKTADLDVGQIWREDMMNTRWEREIVAIDFGNKPGTYPSVEWRRPNAMSTRWCAMTRFRNWINATNARLEKGA